MTIPRYEKHYLKLFASTDALLAHPRGEVPDCLVLDVELPGLNGLDLQSHLAAGDWDTSIVFVARHGDIPMALRTMKAGAVEFLTKPCLDEVLLDAIRRAVDRHSAARRRRAELREIRDAYESLTPRERDVMALVITGMREPLSERRLRPLVQVLDWSKQRAMRQQTQGTFRPAVAS